MTLIKLLDYHQLTETIYSAARNVKMFQFPSSSITSFTNVPLLLLILEL